MTKKKKLYEAEVMEIDTALGVVFGWAFVSTVKGEPYYDLQGHHIPDDVVEQSMVEFMSGQRVMKDSHTGDQIGTVIFGFPLTKDIANALGVHSDIYGCVVGMKPDSDEILEKYIEGEYTGFSIGGLAKLVEDEEIEDLEDA